MTQKRYVPTTLLYLGGRKAKSTLIRFLRYSFFIVIFLQICTVTAKVDSFESYKVDMHKIASSMNNDSAFYMDQIFTPEFLYYFDNSTPYADYAEKLILDEDVKLDDRVIAVLSAQKLPQDRLFNLLEKIVQKAVDGELNPDKSKIFGFTILDAALFPRPNFNGFLYFYYDEPRSKQLLVNARRIPDIEPDLVEKIALAQSGKGRDQYFDLIDIGQIVRQKYKLDGHDLDVMDLAPSQK